MYMYQCVPTSLGINYFIFLSFIYQDGQLFLPLDGIIFSRYLHRLDDELEKLEDLQVEKRHIGSHYRLQHASKEDTIRSIIGKERELFEGPGFGE